MGDVISVCAGVFVLLVMYNIAAGFFGWKTITPWDIIAYFRR